MMDPLRQMCHCAKYVRTETRDRNRWAKEKVDADEHCPHVWAHDSNVQSCHCRTCLMLTRDECTPVGSRGLMTQLTCCDMQLCTLTIHMCISFETSFVYHVLCQILKCAFDVYVSNAPLLTSQADQPVEPWQLTQSPMRLSSREPSRSS